MWSSQIEQLWAEVLVPTEAHAIVLVTPTPPRNPFETELAYDIVLYQGLDSQFVPGVVTMRPHDPIVGRSLYSGVVAFLSAVHRADVLEGLSLIQLCQERICQVRKDRTVMTATQVYQMEPGHAFVVEVGHLRSMAAGSSRVRASDADAARSAASREAQHPRSDHPDVMARLTQLRDEGRIPGFSARIDEPDHTMISKPCLLPSIAGHSDVDPLSPRAVCISGLPDLLQCQHTRTPSVRSNLNDSMHDAAPVLFRVTGSHEPGFVSSPSIGDFPSSPVALRIPSHTQVDDLVREAAEHAPPDPGPPQDEPGGPPPLPVLPEFARQILQGDQQPLGEDWTIGITLRTWFLHMPNSPLCTQPRLLQLVGNALSWRQQILALWLDQIAQIEFLDVHIVTPNPPRPATLGHVAYDILVVQNLWNFKCGLVTAMSAQEPWEYWSVAAFFPPALSGVRLVQNAQLQDVCQHHGCLLFHGWIEIPLNDQPTHQMEDGHGFSVHLRLQAATASSSRGPARALPEQHAIDAPPVAVVPGDAATDVMSDLSAEDAAEEQANNSPGYSPSAHDDPVDLSNLQSVTVHGLNLVTSHVYVRWSTHAQVIVDLAARLGIPLDQVLTFHRVLVRTAGQHPNEEHIILQQATDIPVGSLDQLILMDLEVHYHPGQHILPAFPHVVRKVCRMVQHVTRAHLLMQAGVFHYCSQQLDRCLVHINHLIWPLQDLAARQVVSGTYVRVVVPPPLWQAGGTLQVINLEERRHRTDLPPGVHPYQRPAQVHQECFEPDPQIFPPLTQHSILRKTLVHPFRAEPQPVDASVPAPLVHLAKDVSFSEVVQAGLREQSSGRGGPDPYFHTVRPSPNVGHRSSSLPPLSGSPNHWLLPVGMRVCQQIDATIDRDDFEVEWITWYLGAPYRPRCDETRILRLDVEQELWYGDLCELWHEYLRIDDLTQVLLVEPNPPKAPYEHHVGHLILVQGELEGHVPVVITTIFRNFAGHRISHHACFVPQFSSTATFVAFLQLERVCLVRDCSASIAGFDIPIDGVGEVHAGDNVILHVPARTPDTASFLQLGVHLSPSQLSPVDASEPVSCRMPANPAEIRNGYVRDYQQQNTFFEEAAPLIMGFEQDLLLRWPQFAQPGPGGLEMHIQVRTWFNDHDRWPICDISRDAGLFEDINTWRAALLHTWRDRIDPLRPVTFHLVMPDPTAEIDPIAAHLILLQNPLEDASSVLITVFDDAVWNGHPRRWALRTSVDPTGLEILALMGYRFLCPPQVPAATCQVWCRGQAIGMYERFLTQHGLSLDVHILRRHLQDCSVTPCSDSMESSSTCERLRDSAVAHACRPQVAAHEPVQVSLESALFSTMLEPSLVPLHLIDGGDLPNLPDHILLPDPVDATLAEAELSAMNLSRHVYILGSTGFAFCLPFDWSVGPDSHVYLCYPLSGQSREDIILHRSWVALSELALMQFLHSIGFPRAVILHQSHVRKGLTLVQFHNNEPILEQFLAPPKLQTPWPEPMPCHPARPFFDPRQFSCTVPEHVLTYDVDFGFLASFFESGQDVLCCWHSHLDLPDLVRARLPCPDALEGQRHDLRSFDRFVIHTDGSSKAHNRRRPPLWVQEFDVPDSWAFLVLGEHYSAKCDESSLVLLGWHAQTVTYEAGLSHFIGTDQIGSEFSEREALFWSALWRLSVNLDTPTIFRSDSVTSATQSIGLAGSCDSHPTYMHLRCIMQALQAALPKDCFAVEHVRGHAGDVWNEMVDHLAKTEASTGHRLTHQKVNMDEFCRVLPYLWMLFDKTAGLPVATRAGFDVCPPQLPPVHVCAESSSSSHSQGRKVQLSLSLASLNVGSLFAGPDGYGGKLQYLREQFKAHRLNVIGLQETRSPAGMSTVDDVIRLSSGCDKGQHGVELWLNATQPIGSCSQGTICLRKNHVQVLHADPRRLLARLAHPFLNCFFLVLHGPQSGRSLQERRTWWSETQDLVSQSCAAFPLYVLMDANAKSGPSCEPVVFCHDDACSVNTEFLLNFLKDNDLCLPCTSDIHVGQQHTWTSIDGLSVHRIDYVAVPQVELANCTFSTVLESLEPGNCAEDHRAVALQLQWWTFQPNNPETQLTQPTFNRDCIRTNRDRIPLHAIRAAEWSTDIESQVQAFNHEVLTSLQTACPKNRLSRKKPFLSDSVWNLRLIKLQLQRRLKHAKYHQRQDCMRLAFWAWRQSKAASSLELATANEVLGSHAAHVISVQCSFMSLSCRYFVTARSLKRELQQCKQLQLQNELATTNDKTSAGDLLHLLKPFLGSSNPKKQKKTGLPSVRKSDGSLCATPDEATARWTEFFGHMEGGTPLTTHEYRCRWLSNLGRFRDTGPFALSLSEVPSLVELEAAFRRVAVGKAVGEDRIPPEVCRYKAVDLARITYPMLLKAFLFGQEAIEHKGGRLAVAWKHRGDARDCQTHRSLLVSSHIGKTIHRTLRQRHHSLYTAYMQAQQLGGRPRMPVGIPLHLSRAFMRWQKSLHRPTSLIFLDLTEAFYRIVRPFALGGCLSDEDIATLASRLGFAEDTLHQLHTQLAQPSAIQQAGASPFVQRFLQALHTDTWFRIGVDGPMVRTTIGSRPGDSYADVVFGLLWAKLLHRYEQLLVAHDVLEVLPVHELPDLFSSSESSPVAVERVPFLGPTWMDDLNVCLAADTNLALERKTSFALSLLLDLCQELHMQPNLCKGKTEVMFTFRGAQARAYRRKYFTDARPLQVIGEHQVFSVSVVSRYLHLGGMLHHRDVDRVEVTRRLAIAHQAFTTHRRLLYHNPRIAWTKRREMFSSLVLSKLVYGLESWTLSSQKIKDQFYGGVMRLYRRLLKTPHDSHQTDLELLTDAGLPLPDELLRGCRLRYFGTLHNCGVAAHWGLLCEDSAWTALLQADFQWLWAQLHNTVTLGDPIQHYAAWKDVLVFHGGFWKKLIKRAMAHAVGQRHNHHLALSLHRQIGDVLMAHAVGQRHNHHLALSLHRQIGDVLLSHGWIDALPSFDLECDPSAAYGCMKCGTRHLSHAGECVHMFKCHHRVAPARSLFDETHCPACLREFHARSKVRAHLRHAHQCRQSLLGKRLQCHVQPGVGSAVDRQLHDRHDGALPFQQAAGPVQPPDRLRDFDSYCISLFEGLSLCLLELSDPQSLSETLQHEIRQHAVCWTTCRKTLCYFLDEFSQADADPLVVSFESVVHCVRCLCEPAAWPFLQTPCLRPSRSMTGELPLWEQWYEAIAWTPPAHWSDLQPLPRSLTKQRIILHAYAGRRRRGDIEWYIDAMSAHYSAVVLQVVSIDIIIDEVYGDISRATTRSFWLRHISQGHVVGFLAGPPCNTWSRARAHQLEAARGPRVVRTPDEPWGKQSLSLRELTQVGLGTLLLGFALQCMLALALHSGAGFLEHPKEPDEPEHGTKNLIRNCRSEIRFYMQFGKKLC
eukprot:s39_g38.t1